MRPAARVQQTSNKYTSTVLTVVLTLVSLCIAVFIAKGGEKSAALIIGGIAGLGILILIILYPVTGFYCSIVTGVFFADIVRLLAVDLPFGVLLDILMILTFF